MNSNNILLVHSGTVIEDDRLTLEQLCEACNVSIDWIHSLIEESIIEPHGQDIQLWRFSGACLIRVRKAVRLQHDLGVNLAGIALALDLIGEIESLREQMKILSQS